MQHYRNLLVSLLFFPIPTFAQEWLLKDSVELPSEPLSFSTDLYNNLYFGFKNGQIIKYSPGGEQLGNYALPGQSAIDLIEGQNHLKIFLFQRDNQTFSYLDRFNALPKEYLLYDYGVSYAIMSCPSVDQQVWVVENNPERLSKIDLLKNIRILENQIPLGDSISYMRAFQNLLVISSEAGTFILDQYGRIFSQLPEPSATFIQYIDNQLYIILSKQIAVYDPYTAKKITSIELPREATFTYYGQQEVILTKGKKIYFYYRE